MNFHRSELSPFAQALRKHYLHSNWKMRLPDAIPIVVDGELFWYGAKMMEAVDYFKEQFYSL
ncbi:hypothetical protein [Sporosarcina limicola]|uniref:Uncharacterized protein n=1 Tax=Sporosarcina limicola TaxID=34101 RepID=A0A927MHS1_9BACL|nr:hypothetical protein [Sporosarcina limicola]MBE1554929.1 hypothetical protein [Sporosarcina limicola]